MRFWSQATRRARRAALAAGAVLVVGASACSSNQLEPAGPEAGASGGVHGSGGVGGALGMGPQGGVDGGVGCRVGDPWPFVCSQPSEGTCYHDPLPADCDAATGQWGCSFGTVRAPEHNCAGSGGAGGHCDPLPPLGATGGVGAGVAPSDQLVSLGPATKYPSGGRPFQLALADLDGDRRLDILVTSDNGDVSAPVSGLNVLLNQGSGTFASPRFHQGRGPYQTDLAVGDLNGDGKPDIVVTGGPYLDVLLNNGDGTLGTPVPVDIAVSTFAVAIADLDGDGRNDLVLGASGEGVIVLFNRGDGSFTASKAYPAGYAPSALAAGDLNGDDRPDLAVVSYSSGGPGNNNLSVMLNRGGGDFAPAVAYPAGEFLTSVTMGDLDGDGHRDIVVLDSYARLAGLLNQGDGTFAAPVSYGGDASNGAVALGDVTGDGRLDIVAADTLRYGSSGWIGGNVSVLVNQGGGAFGPPLDFTDEPIERSIVLGDLNEDGKLDAVAVNRSYECMDTISVLLNTSR